MISLNNLSKSLFLRVTHVRLLFLFATLFIVASRLFSIFYMSDNQMYFLVLIGLLSVGCRFEMGSRIFVGLLSVSLISWIFTYFDLSNVLATIGFLAFSTSILFELIHNSGKNFIRFRFHLKDDIKLLYQDSLRISQNARLRFRVQRCSVFVMIFFLIFNTGVLFRNFHFQVAAFYVQVISLLLIGFLFGLVILHKLVKFFPWILKNYLLLISPVVLLILYLSFSSSYVREKLELPYIIDVTPNQTSIAWEEVRIHGRQFKNKPFVGTVTIDDIEQRVVYWSDSKIIFIVNPNDTKSGKITVRNDESKQSNLVDFLYEED